MKLKDVQRLKDRKLDELRKLKLGDLSLGDFNFRRRKTGKKKWMALGAIALMGIAAAAWVRQGRKP